MRECLLALILASAFVLYTRLNTTGSSTTVLGVLLSVALLGAGIMARWRRPNDLHIAVLADIKLKLKQRLSTAWEFARAQPDSEISTRLAVQVVKQRLPLRSEPVFPVRINTWGKLIPIAVALLVLVNVVDLGKINDHSIIEIDDSVVAEGKRVREFAERLGAWPSSRVFRAVERPRRKRDSWAPGWKAVRCHGAKHSVVYVNSQRM